MVGQDQLEPQVERGVASMGPRLDNRGWAPVAVLDRRIGVQLQWVHGWITVVGRAVIGRVFVPAMASMGPRLDNRGWASKRRWPIRQSRRRRWLQWVHGWITVVGPNRFDLL